MDASLSPCKGKSFQTTRDMKEIGKIISSAMRIPQNLSPSRRKATPMCLSHQAHLLDLRYSGRCCPRRARPQGMPGSIIAASGSFTVTLMMETGSNPIFSTAPTRDYSSTQASGERWKTSQPVQSVWSWLRNCTKKLIISMITTSFSNTQGIMLETIRYARHHV